MKGRYGRWSYRPYCGASGGNEEMEREQTAEVEQFEDNLKLKDEPGLRHRRIWKTWLFESNIAVYSNLPETQNGDLKAKHMPRLQPAERAIVSVEAPKNPVFPIIRPVLRLESLCMSMLHSKATDIFRHVDKRMSWPWDLGYSKRKFSRLHRLTQCIQSEYESWEKSSCSLQERKPEKGNLAGSFPGLTSWQLDPWSWRNQQWTEIFKVALYPPKIRWFLPAPRICEYSLRVSRAVSSQTVAPRL